MRAALRGRRRLVVGFTVAVAALVVLPFVGRWERNHNARVQNTRMLAVYRKATAHGLLSPELDRYRLDIGFDCLIYHPAGKPQYLTAYELCFDGEGRLVQTIDRTGKTTKFASLIEQHSLATFKVPVSTLMTIFVKLGILQNPHIRGTPPTSKFLPTAGLDTGALRFPRRPRG